MAKDEAILRERRSLDPGVVKHNLGSRAMRQEKAAVGRKRRKGQRFRVNAPISIPLGDQALGGFTRDMSNRGVYFYLDSAQSPPKDGNFEFFVELPSEITTTSCCQVWCLGRVKRIEKGNSHLTGYAAEILKYSIKKAQRTILNLA